MPGQRYENLGPLPGTGHQVAQTMAVTHFVNDTRFSSSLETLLRFPLNRHPPLDRLIEIFSASRQSAACRVPASRAASLTRLARSAPAKATGGWAVRSSPTPRASFTSWHDI